MLPLAVVGVEVGLHCDHLCLLVWVLEQVQFLELTADQVGSVITLHLFTINEHIKLLNEHVWHLQIANLPLHARERQSVASAFRPYRIEARRRLAPLRGVCPHR